MQVKKQQSELDMEPQTGSKQGQEYVKAVYCHPVYLTYLQNTEVHLVKAMVFPVVMYGCELDYKESWALKNWCFWTVVLEKTLESPWTARRSNQSILKEISLEYSLGGLMLKLKLQYFGLLMKELTHLKRPWCWERLKLGREGDDRRWDGWILIYSKSKHSL